MFRKLLLPLACVATVGGLLLSMPDANAVTVTIGLSDGGAITTEATGTGVASFSGTFGSTFTANLISGLGNPPLTGSDLVNSNSINISTVGAGTLYVYVTVSGITGPLGSTVPLQSSFTTNVFSGSITSVATATFIDTANGLFSGTALSSAFFTGIGAQAQTVLANTGGGPYSITEVYTIVASGIGNVNSTIDVSAALVAPLTDAGVGLPGLALLSGGLLFWLRRSRKSQDIFSNA